MKGTHRAQANLLSHCDRAHPQHRMRELDVGRSFREICAIGLEHFVARVVAADNVHTHLPECDRPSAAYLLRELAEPVTILIALAHICVNTYATAAIYVDPDRGRGTPASEDRC